MANSELNFSVRLQMLTDQFNQGLRESRSAFEAATQSIIGNTNDLRTNSTRAEQALTTLFNAPSNDLTATIQNTTAQLNGLVRGANISEEQLQRAFATAANHVQNLSNDLDAARAHLQNMTLAGASLTSIQQAQTEIAQLEQRLGQAQTASTELGNAMSSALNRASQTAQQTEASIDRLLGVRSNNVITSDINAISQALNHLQTEFEQGRISQQEFNRMTQAGEARLQSLQNELTGTTNAVARHNNAQGDLRGNLGSVSNAFGSLQGLLAAVGVSFGAMEIIQIADDFKNLESRVRLATGAGVEFVNGFDGVKQIANDTRLSLESTGELFAKMTQATQDLDISQSDLLTTTKAINQAIVVSGAGAEQASAGIMQLSQGLAGGIIRAEEYNSVMENMPRVMQAAAAGLGMSMGEIRQYMLDGKLTAEDFLNAVKSQAAVLQAEFDSMPVTFSQSVQVLKNNFMLLIGDMDKTLQSSSGLSQGIMDIADNLENIDPAIISALEQGMSSLWEVAKTVGTTLLEIYNTFSDVLNIAGGIDETTEQVGFLTRSLQGVSIVMGVIADGIKGVKIIFDAVVGAAYDLGSALSKAWSMVTFGDVSKRFAEASDQMKAKSDEFLKKFQDDTAGFKSSAVAAFDEAAKTQQQRLTETAQASEQAYLKMAADSKASAAQQQEAFAQYAKDAIRANNGVVSERLEAQAAEAGLQIAISKTGEISVQAAEKAIDANNEFKEKQKGVAKSVKELGLDVDKASLGISESFRKTSAAVMDVGNNFDELKAQGYDASNLLVQGLDKLLASANNQKEIDAVRQMYIDFGKDGKLSARQVEDGIEAVNKKLDKSPELLDETAKALKELGIITKAEGEKQSQEQIRNFEIAKKSFDNGMISAEQMRAAAEKVGRTVEASGTDAQKAWLDSQKSALGVKDAVDKTTESTERLTRSASNVGTAYQNAARLSVQELEEVSKRLDFLNTKNKELQAQWAKDSAARDEGNRATTAKSMQSVANYSTLTAMENFLKSAGLSDEQAMKQAQTLMNQYGKNGRMNWTAANGLTEGAALTTQQMANFKDPTAYLLDIAEKIRYNQAKQDTTSQNQATEKLTQAVTENTRTVTSSQAATDKANQDYIAMLKAQLANAPANEKERRQIEIDQIQSQGKTWNGMYTDLHSIPTVPALTSSAPNKTINVNLNFDGQSLPMTIDADKEQLFNDFINRLQSDSKRQAR